MSMSILVVHAQLPSFSCHDIFHFISSMSFQTSCSCLASLPRNSKFTKTSCRCFLSRFFYFLPVVNPLLRGPTFSWSNPFDPIPPLLLYVKLLFPINKQFSIDTYLDWEGLHWDFCLMFTSPAISVPFSASILTPKHQTRYSVSSGIINLEGLCKGNQGGLVGFILVFHPIIPGLTPTEGDSQIKDHKQSAFNEDSFA